VTSAAVDVGLPSKAGSLMLVLCLGLGFALQYEDKDNSRRVRVLYYCKYSSVGWRKNRMYMGR
jgi:hypothetical protein